MVNRPSSAAPTNNGASEGDSLHRTRRAWDGNLFSAVVANKSVLRLADSLLRHFFVNASTTKKITFYRLPVNDA